MMSTSVVTHVTSTRTRSPSAEAVRQAVAEQHSTLRDQLMTLESTALATLSAADEVPLLVALRALAAETLASLEMHQQFEDQHLGPALRHADAWGPVRCERMRDEHERQTAILRAVADDLATNRRTACELARELLGLVSTMMADIDEEDREFLDPNVLRDDLIVVEQDDG